MGYKYLPVIIAGLAVTAICLPTAYRVRSFWAVLAAIAALAGVIATLAGTLLFTVPNFFAR
jgi:hypothetical protein